MMPLWCPRLVYVGSQDGMEADLVARESNLPFRAIPTAALRGRSPLTIARNLGTLMRGVRAARRLLGELRPGAILGTGGYVCVPLFLAAWMARIPTLVFLPDVVPGMAVRFLARFSTAVACSVAASEPFFRGRKLHITGYPVRRELFQLDRTVCRRTFGLTEDLPALLVYGGSRGARSINQAIGALLSALLSIAYVIHICGREGDEIFLRERAMQLPELLRSRYRLHPYLHNERQAISAREQGGGTAGDPAFPSMIEAFGAADLVVCRSGASVLGELPAAGLPAVLVPYPYVHQEENADYLVREGVAAKIQDSEMLGNGSPEEGPLFQQIRFLLQHPSERITMSRRSRALARLDASDQLAYLLLALERSKGSTQ